MPRDALALPRPGVARARRQVTVHPDFAAGFAARGLDSPADFLDLPGEVVCGHPDRHVVRVEVPGFPNAFYLKRQHAVGWREKMRNAAAGFGWVSRCEREAAVLARLAAAGLPCPRWAAVGAGAGRAFLLVEEVAGAVDLRAVLSGSMLSPTDRAGLADRLGRVIAELHAGGLTTPDLTAKHVLVSRGLHGITPIDWQSSRVAGTVSWPDRARSLAALHASVPDELASPRERLRVLRAALRPARVAGLVRGQFSELARRVASGAKGQSGRRSVRDQRQLVVTGTDQRLVWVAGETVCATPDVAAVWQTPAVAAPFYGCEPGTLPVELPDGRGAWLVRGRSFAPLGRARAWATSRPWRSPGVTLGRMLFHLERYGIPGPRLLAFGQLFTGFASAEWFALHTPPVEPLPEWPDDATAAALGRCLRSLHDAGCRLEGYPRLAFGVTPAGPCVRDVTAFRLVRRVPDHTRDRDLARLLNALAPAAVPAVEAGYFRR